MHVSLKVTKAELSRDNNPNGKMSPFIKIVNGGEVYETQIAKEGDKEPQWNDNFDFQLTGEGNIKVSVWNSATLSLDSLLGETILNLPSLAKSGQMSGWQDIIHRDQQTGKIWVEFKMDQPVFGASSGACLMVRPIKADLVHDTKFFGKMDPFCQIVVNGKEYNSAVCSKGGKEPKWVDTFAVPLSGDGAVRLLVWESNGEKNHLVGETSMNLFQMEKLGMNQSHEIFYKGKKAGMVFLSVTTVAKDQ